MTDTERLQWLEWMMYFHYATVNYGMAKGCRCLSCYEYTISWDNEQDEPILVSGESLIEVIDRAALIQPYVGG